MVEAEGREREKERESSGSWMKCILIIVAKASSKHPTAPSKPRELPLHRFRAESGGVLK